MYSTSSLQGVWHHIHGCLHQICQCKVPFDQYVTTNIRVLFPYMVSLYNAVATGCNQSFYKSHQGGNSQLQSSCDQLRFSPVASPSEKLQLDFKTLRILHLQSQFLPIPILTRVIHLLTSDLPIGCWWRTCACRSPAIFSDLVGDSRI